MKKLFVLFILSIFLTHCENEKKETNTNAKHSTRSEEILKEIPVYETFSDLAPLFQNESDTTYIVNFWATTCPPCLREMPYFAELERVYETDKMRVILVSLDLKEHLNLRVLPYMKKHNIKPKVVLLADQNYSAWTDEIDTSWYGALPATLILSNERKKFSFGAYESFDDLEQEVNPFLYSY